MKTVAEGGRCSASDSDGDRLAGTGEKTSEAHTRDVGAYILASGCCAERRNVDMGAVADNDAQGQIFGVSRCVYVQQSAAVVSAGCERPAYGSAASEGHRESHQRTTQRYYPTSGS